MNMRKNDGRHWVALISCFLLGGCITTSTTDFSSHAPPKAVAVAAPAPAPASAPPPPAPAPMIAQVPLSQSDTSLRSTSSAFGFEDPANVLGAGNSKKSFSPRKQSLIAPAQATNEVVTDTPANEANAVRSDDLPPTVNLGNNQQKITVLIGRKTVDELNKLLLNSEHKVAKSSEAGSHTPVALSDEMEVVCDGSPWFECTLAKGSQGKILKGANGTFQWDFDLIAKELGDAKIRFAIYRWQGSERKHAELGFAPKPLSIKVVVNPQTFYEKMPEWITKNTALLSAVAGLLSAVALVLKNWAAIVSQLRPPASPHE